MGFFRDAAFAAAGYGLHELMDGDGKQNGLPNKTLEDIIDDYAHAHDVWGRDERFYRHLKSIIKKYHDPYASEDDEVELY